MKKHFSFLFRLVSLSLMGLLLFGSFFFALLQTKWSKEKIKTYVEKMAAEQGIILQIGDIQGVPPFTWNIDTLQMQLPSKDCIAIEGASLRIAPLPLLRRQLTISYLSVDKAELFLEADSSKEFSLQGVKKEIEALSFSSKKVRVKQCIIHNGQNKEEIAFSFDGSVKLKADLKDISLSMALQTENHNPSYASIQLEGGRKKGFLHASLQLDLDSTEILKPLIVLPFSAAFTLHGSLEGPIQSWDSMLEGKTLAAAPLEGSVKGHISQLHIPSHEYVDRPWDIDSSFALSSFEKIQAKRVLIDSDLLSLQGRGDLPLNKELPTFSATFSIKKCPVHASLSFINLQESLHGKISYSPTQASCSLQTEHIQLFEETFAAMQFSLESSNEQNVWKGSSTLSLDGQNLPLKGSSQFTYQDNLLSIYDICFISLANKLSGDLSYHFQKHSIDASFFACLTQLKEFRCLFPDSHLEGSLAANICLHADKALAEDLENPACQVDLLLNNVRWGDTFVSRLSANADLTNILTSPVGSFTLEGENLFSSRFYLTKVCLSSQTSDGMHPFAFSVQGIWKEEFDLYGSGAWKKEAEHFTIIGNELCGKALQKSFSLQKPCHILWAAQQLQIQDCALQLDTGSLSGSLLLQPTSADIQIEASHIPLDLLSIKYPAFSLRGTTSFTIKGQGEKENFQGQLNLVVEEAKLDQVGNKKNLQAKGSLQAHFGSQVMQLHSHIYATEQQFLELTATLPVTYSFFPFTVQVDKERPLSCELTAQGALEEIFDFINVGSHKTTGLITSHLFLSKTLQTPSLLGEVSLQAGSYANYYMGATLKNINTACEASAKEIKLLHFSATDENKGTLEATGNLLLNPEQQFPFSLTAELQHLHFLRQENMDGTFSGPLYITGNTLSAEARGSLIVNEATVELFDELPYEVPSLPITYINKPIHLQISSLSHREAFPLHLDIDLSAEDTISIKGKGLSSLWQGDLRVTGINANLAANGSLQLVKGEYTFSGKTFTLTQGEISFAEKPTPSAFLKLSGTLQLGDIAVFASLQGPLTTPALTFQSIPHLPTSSILARILFNKDISEISAMQALQLAHVIVSLSGGGGPDILEAIRRSIGLDRLTIVGKDDSDEISLQIGWYLTHGVTVTLSQSVTSSDVTIEVDLKKGFIFQAETQNQEEGKFSLKWNKNY